MNRRPEPPEGEPNHCPVCGQSLRIDPSLGLPGELPWARYWRIPFYGLVRKAKKPMMRESVICEVLSRLERERLKELLKNRDSEE